MKKLILIFTVILTTIAAPKIIGAVNTIQKHQSQNIAQVVAFNTEKGVVKW